MDESKLVSFYLDQAPDLEGRMIEEIWAWSDEELEEPSTIIHWLFPLRESSQSNPDAPRLTRAEMLLFQTDPELRRRVLKSLLVMLAFYGLKVTTSASQQVEVLPSDDFSDRREFWMAPESRHYNRFTRILKSLRYLGLDPFAQALFRCLDSFYRAEGEEYIPFKNYAAWKTAVH